MIRSNFWVFLVLAIIVLVLFFPVFEVLGIVVFGGLLLAILAFYVRWRSRDE